MFLDSHNQEHNYPALFGSLLFFVLLFIFRIQQLFKEEPAETPSPTTTKKKIKKLKSILKRRNQERYKLRKSTVKKSKKKKKKLHWGENQVYDIERIYYSWEDDYEISNGKNAL
jgi:hypothetical protein